MSHAHRMAHAHDVSYTLSECLSLTHVSYTHFSHVSYTQCYTHSVSYIVCHTHPSYIQRVTQSVSQTSHTHSSVTHSDTHTVSCTFPVSHTDSFSHTQTCPCDVSFTQCHTHTRCLMHTECHNTVSPTHMDSIMHYNSHTNPCCHMCT